MIKIKFEILNFEYALGKLNEVRKIRWGNDQWNPKQVAIVCTRRWRSCDFPQILFQQLFISIYSIHFSKLAFHSKSTIIAD